MADLEAFGRDDLPRARCAAQHPRQERDDWRREAEMLCAAKLIAAKLREADERRFAPPERRPMVASVGGLRSRERPLHAAFRRPSIQPKRPDKMMAGAAGPSAAVCWARSALSAAHTRETLPAGDAESR